MTSLAGQPAAGDDHLERQLSPILLLLLAHRSVYCEACKMEVAESPMDIIIYINIGGAACMHACSV